MWDRLYLVFIGEGLFGSGEEIIDLRNSELIRHPFEAWKCVGDSASLLMGFALENALKGHLIHTGEIYIDESNKVKGLNSSHDLVSMIGRTTCTLNNREMLTIKRLTFQLQSLSKYHLAKNAIKQKEFTGIVDNPSMYYVLITDIIFQLFEGEFRDLYLESDGSYNHIPRLPCFGM